MPKYLSEEESHRRANWKANCLSCNTSFGWSKNGDKAKYCSRVCAGKANGKVVTDFGKLVSYSCNQCKKPFTSYHKNRKFCCIDCSRKNWSENMPKGYACRKDNNHKDVVDALTAAGACVIDTSRLGAGFPDLIVGFNSITVLIEIKNPKTQYGRSGLNKRQKDWHASWNGGPLAIVDSPEAALRVLGVMAPESENLRKHIKEHLSNEALAVKHGVHVRTIEKAVSYKSWEHIV